MSDEVIKNPNRGTKNHIVPKPAYVEMNVDPEPIFDVDPGLRSHLGDSYFDPELPPELRDHNVIVNNGTIDNNNNMDFFSEPKDNKETPLYILLDNGKIVSSGSKNVVLDALKKISNLNFKIKSKELIILKQINIKYDISLE